LLLGASPRHGVREPLDPALMVAETKEDQPRCVPADVRP
jgi:hypothetical protein